jgi:hypothetical protein
VLRYEDFTLLLSGGREVEDGNACVLAFHVQVPAAAGFPTITEPVASRCNLENVRRLAEVEPPRSLPLATVLAAGSELGRGLLPGAVLATVRQALAHVRSRGHGLRLRIVGDALHWVCWEYAILPPERGEPAATDFLALMPDVSIVRDQACPVPNDVIELRPPFRILCAAAHPKLAPRIDIAEERRLLEAALRDVRGVELQWLEGGTRPAPSAALLRAQMFHFAGHGAFGLVTAARESTRDVTSSDDEPGQPEAPGTGLLIFDDGSGGEDRVTAGELGVLLRELGVRVAVLNACKSARSNAASVWGSVASALLRAGVHSVIAMQHAILDASAIRFAAAFYRSLAEQASLDEAAHRGRMAVFASGDGFGWGTPVLYLPEKFDGAVFRAAPSPVIRAPRRNDERIDYDIELQRHRGFVGRVELLAWLDRLLVADSRDRWVIVTGSPGMGKSALLATWLARRKAAGALVPHHFIRRGQYDWDDPAKLVGSLVAQIEERFPDQHASAADYPQHPASRLATTLMRVSTTELVPRGVRLVVLIDGLDQYDPPAGASTHDPLAAFLPHVLPPGVSFLCASSPREPHLKMLQARDGAQIQIDLDGPESAADNEATVREFLQSAAPSFGLDARFIDQAATRTRGNLQRAVTLLKQLESSLVVQCRVDDSPHGIARPAPAAELKDSPITGAAGLDPDDNAATSGHASRPLARSRATTDRPLRLGRRRGFYVAAGFLPAAAAAVLLVLLFQPLATTSDVAIHLAPERFVDVRFTAGPLDHHRELAVMRAAGAAPVDQTEWIRQDVLAALEERGDRNALVGALALNGELAFAEQVARNLSRSAASLTDRAGLALLEAEHTARATPRLTPMTEAEHVADARISHKEIGAAVRALSLTADALRLTPHLAQAAWNQAIALRWLGLSLAAASRFDDVAASREPGWSDEAAMEALRLRSDYQRDVDDWNQVKADAERMVLGGPVLSEAAVARAPSLARDSFYLALATAATTDRIDALAALARTLDVRFGQNTLTNLVARIRGSDLQARAPSAAELRTFIEHHERSAAINAVRDRALQRDLPDIVLASLLAVDERAIDDADLRLLDKLLVDNLDDWWKVVALALHAYQAEFWRRDYPAVDAIARSAEPICKTLRSRWCNRILLFAGDANSQMGRADLAMEQITAALNAAKLARMPSDEADALWQLGQAIATRVADDIDSAAVAGAYLEEVTQRKATCRARLQGLDFTANTALEYHRFDEAARLRRDTDALERGACRDARLRLNGETARLRLLLSGRDHLETLRANIARLESSDQGQPRLYLDFLSAGANLVEDRPRGEAALRLVIEAASTYPIATYAPLVRASSLDLLVESNGQSGNATAVLGLLTERLGAPRLDRCVLGIASWNHLVVATLDGEGRLDLETRDVPEGMVMIPPRDAVSPRMRAHLANCRRIDVLAAAPYFGAPGLLDDRAAWVYHAGALRAPSGPAPRHELVVSDVAPPDDLHLPPLQPFSGATGSEVLSGARATPANVLAAMKTASLAVIVAHGFTAAEPTAAAMALSPDAEGDYLLTASKVRSAVLAGAPIVVLAGCDAGRVQVSAEPWSLATSFLEAGARVVIAPTEPIPDASANEVFRALIDRIRAGTDPAEALVTERSARGDTAPWLSNVVVFE